MMVSSNLGHYPLWPRRAWDERGNILDRVDSPSSEGERVDLRVGDHRREFLDVRLFVAVQFRTGNGKRFTLEET